MSTLQQQVHQLSTTLSKWNEKPKSTVSSVLSRLQKVSMEDLAKELSESSRKSAASEFESLTKPILAFHKEMQNLDDAEQGQDRIDNEWFGLLIKLRKKIKKIAEILEKSKNKSQAPEMKKKLSVTVEYPPELKQDCRESEIKILEVLYKNFLANFPEAAKHPRTVDFVKEINKEVRKLFEDEADQKRDNRIDSICVHLAKETAVRAKREMLEGLKTARQVAQDDEFAFKDSESLKRIEEEMAEQMKASEMGYYDKMKRSINQGASEECRFCRKQSAYCDDMKQIRASDEPMTRFMKCNNCNKNWRD